MKIILSGGTGFLGRKLNSHLTSLGHQIVVIRRSDWEAGTDRISKLINSCEVVINLAGSPVIKRWSTQNKREMRERRIKPIETLVECLLKLPLQARPKCFISASAIGIYNHVGRHTEYSTDYDRTFLSELCQEWEKALDPLLESDIRVCIARIGIVLGKGGGMMDKVLPLFRFGLGGVMASGDQPFSFIHVEDFCRAIAHLSERTDCHGIFNMVSPHPVDNRYFTKVLANVCKRPAWLPVPALALKLIYGQAAVSMIEGQSVLPERLMATGFLFRYPDLESALGEIVNPAEPIKH
ncbi:MAG: TIGR01777 family oxidoreductase [Marinilabiliales bacterium]|nr:TIGR01777 family oxidoreductase [Marinilabiliales bacterium]